MPKGLRTRVRAAMVLGLIGAASGCSLGKADPDYLMPAKRIAEVREAAETFGYNLRWGRIDAAALVVHPAQRRVFLNRVQAVDPPLQFTSFEILDIRQGEERSAVTVLASFSMYQPPSLVERTANVEQLWRYDAHAGRWWIEPDLDPILGPGPGASTHP